MSSSSLGELKQLRYNIKLDWYRQAALARSADSRGIERYMYGIFGPSLIGHIALAIDPSWQLSKNPYSDPHRTCVLQSVVPVKRTRAFLCVRESPVTVHYRNTYETWSNTWVTPPPYFTFGSVERSSGVYADYTAVGFTQQKLYGYMHDTTSKLRGRYRIRNIIYGSNQGEFEYWSPSMPFTGINLSYTPFETVARLYVLDQLKVSGIKTKLTLSNWTGPLSVVLPSSSDRAGAIEKIRAEELFADKAMMLYSMTVPTHKQYQLSYNIGELKDLPQLLRGSFKILRDLVTAIGYKRFVSLLTHRSEWTPSVIASVFPFAHSLGWWKSLPKSVGDAFLTFKFGWQSTYQAYDGLLKAPSAVSKRLNFLIKQNGKSATFHTTIGGIEPIDGFSPFDYYHSPPGLFLDELRYAEGVRKYKIRCTINALIDMPELDVPRLRSRVYWELFGAIPDPTDVYNLTPWTWLADWFWGVGDYVRCLRTVNSDPNLINWGLLSYTSTVRYTRGQVQSYVSDTSSSDIPGGSSSAHNVQKVVFTSLFEGKFHLRQDLSRYSMGVKYTTLTPTLSTSQLAIIGALLSKFTG